jgi:hypothetical protein
VTQDVTYNLASSGDGLKTLRLWAMDASGVISATPGSTTFYLDTTVPTVSITTSLASQTTSASQSFVFTTNDSGGVIDYAQCKLDSGSWTNCTSPVSYTGLSEAAHTFSLKAFDTAGNVSTVASSSWTVDLTNPVLSLSGTPDAVTQSLVSVFSFSATDTGGIGSYSCNLDSAGWSSCTSPWTQTLAAGSHTLQIKALDVAGNVSTVSSTTWIIDLTAPSLSISSSPANPINSANASLVFSATDSGGGTVASYSCKLDGGSYASCTSPVSYTALADGSHTFYVKATDTAGNVSSVQTATWVSDTSAPTISITTPASNGTYVGASSVAAMTVSGACSENGRNVSIAGDITQTATCSGGSWSASLNISSLAEGTVSITASHTDAAGNATTTTARTFIKDATSFSLTDANLAATPVAFSYSTDGGSTWTSIIAAVANVSPYAWSAPVINSTTVKIKIVATDIAGNQSMAISSSNLSFDSSVPVISSLVINGGVATTASNSIPVNLTASSSTGAANISYFCLKYNDSSAPTASDSCWVLLSRNDVNVTPATSISFSNFYISVGFSSITYTVYAWVMDEVQQISASANAAVTLQPGSPPVVSSILVSNHDSPTLPLTSSDTSFAYHSDVYIYWNVSDAEGLAANQVKIEYSLDDTTWTTIVSSLSETSQTGCNLVAGANGCYKWSGGAPTDDGSGTPGTTADDKSFKIRITGVDTSGMVSSGTSVNVNTGSLSLIAGNTNPGLNGSSSSAVFFSYSANNNPSNAVFTITSKGELFFLDYLRGLIYVSPTDGIQTLLLATNNSFGTENGSVATASLKLPYKIGMDNLNNIYVFDYDRIRKINTSVSPMTITTIIGGGASNGLTTVTGLNFQLTSTSYTTALSGAVFHVLGNGDIWFSSENYDGLQTSIRKRIRFYNHTDGNVYSYNVSGTGNSVSGTIDMAATDTFIQKWAVAYDPNSFLTTKFMVTSLRSTTTQSLWGLSVIDTSTWTVSGTHPTGLWAYHYTAGYYYTGLDGNIYLIDYDSTKILKFNIATNTFSTIYGTASNGYCPANTTATSCNALLAGIFVNKQGKVYVVDNNIVRTIDEAGKVQDVFGQMQSYGENTLATNARFKEVSAIGAWYDTSVNKTKIIISDRYGFKIKESTVGGNISTIAGSGLLNSLPTKSIDATTTPLITEGVNGSTNAIHMFVDPVNGNVYKGQSSNLNYVLQRGSPNHWENMITTGAGPFTSMDSDSLIGSPIAAGNVTWGNYSSTFFMGMNANSILMLDHDYDSAASQHRGGALLEYNRSSVTIEKIGGKYGQPNSSFNLCADGTLATSCVTFYSLLYSGAGYTHAEYDAYLDSWIFGIIGTNAIRILKKGTNLSTLVNVASGVRSIAYVRVGGASPTKRKLWYCNSSGVLKEYDLLTSTETALNWKISNMTCTTNYLIYSAERNSLIFPVSQNNLQGVAEYLLP